MNDLQGHWQPVRSAILATARLLVALITYFLACVAYLACLASVRPTPLHEARRSCCDAKGNAAAAAACNDASVRWSDKAFHSSVMRATDWVHHDVTLHARSHATVGHRHAWLHRAHNSNCSDRASFGVAMSLARQTRVRAEPGNGGGGCRPNTAPKKNQRDLVKCGIANRCRYPVHHSHKLFLPQVGSIKCRFYMFQLRARPSKYLLSLGKETP